MTPPRPAATSFASAARFAATCFLLACTTPRAAPPEPSAEPRVVLRASDGRAHPVRVEVARGPADRARGLMYRKHLDADAGMLFVFDEEDEHPFWMKNTLIPLDMIFIDSGFSIVGIVERAEPLTETSRTVRAASRYVLEVNGGFCAERGVRPGDRVEFLGVKP